MLGIRPEQAPQPSTTWIGPAPWLETQIPGPLARRALAKRSSHSLVGKALEQPLVVQRALGSVVEDIDGNRFLDLAAGQCVSPAGHCHPKIIGSMNEQANNAVMVCRENVYYPVTTETLQKTSAICSSPRENDVLLTEGTTATVALAWSLAKITTGRQRVVAIQAGVSQQISHVASKFRLAASTTPDLSTEHVGQVSLAADEPLEKCLFDMDIDPKETCAVILQVFQGDEGYILDDREMQRQIRDFCDQYNIPLIVDETETCLGRTGKWFAFEHFDIAPDMIMMSHGSVGGTPLGALIARKAQLDAKQLTGLIEESACPISCATALATMDVIENGLMDNANTLANRFQNQLREFAASSRILTRPRGLGVIGSLDVVNPRNGALDSGRRDRIVRHAFERGVMVKACGEVGIRIAPPLCINKTQLDVGLTLLRESIEAAT
ncbi:MAG: aminotransferase class III-fold pyridoxal phosphate-dependent enzyme [Phycisphaerae bacterium]